jgi:hypothetical protein
MSLLHNHPPNMATTTCPACIAPIVPHVWTKDEIKALPEFGEHHGWFYGLVNSDEDGEQRIELAEVFPGMGWASPDPEDIAENWSQIESDLRYLRFWPIDPRRNEAS